MESVGVLVGCCRLIGTDPNDASANSGGARLLGCSFGCKSAGNTLKKKKKNLTVPFSRLCPRVCLRPPSLSPPPTLRLSRYVSSPWRSAYSALPRCIWRCARARVPHKLRYSDWISTFSNGQGAKLKVFIYVHNFFNLIYVIILTCIFTGGLVDTGDFVLKRDLFQTYNKQTTISCRQTHTHTHTKSNIKPK